ncbi:hypothetical protein CGX12_04540 [Zobellella denitrificans]|jgi:hypothetical protein|uniref:Uncharacterized protein n=1 Tax=Zobellella denitrificans TaxID=347534 RepID=A0A231N1D9_9GAMM|nr:hypothetical protein [Zobellella denitrificans]ATG75587.1 hypothetical protein AN401_18455 [Zobellella denitrificans]OXS16311.1 hypothetical protein CGX12_04540 [Zobellella denitrificans]
MAGITRPALRKLLWLLLLPPLAAPEADREDMVRFRLFKADIDAVAEYDGALWLQLSPSAASRFRELTRQAHGRMLEIELDGQPLVHSRVQATVTSGLIRITQASAERRSRSRLQQR